MRSSIPCGDCEIDDGGTGLHETEEDEKWHDSEWDVEMRVLRMRLLEQWMVDRDGLMARLSVISATAGTNIDEDDVGVLQNITVDRDKKSPASVLDRVEGATT